VPPPLPPPGPPEPPLAANALGIIAVGNTADSTSIATNIDDAIAVIIVIFVILCLFLFELFMLISKPYGKAAPFKEFCDKGS
jgi:hypothetical protein